MTTTINRTNFSFKQATVRMLSIFMLAVMMMTGISGTVQANSFKGDKNLGISIKDGEVVLKGDGNEDIWTKMGTELSNIIAAIAAIATVAMVGMCVFNMTKVATAGTNAKARTEALQAVGWTLAASFGLGSVTVWVALARNTGVQMHSSNGSRHISEETSRVASLELDTALENLELTM